MALLFKDLGITAYADTWELQKQLFNQKVQQKLLGHLTDDVLLFCEHQPVYTIGKFGKQQNLLVSEEMLNEKGASLYSIERGGDITFHGPGQLVVYPILDLDYYKLGVKQYVHLLEEIVILLLESYSICANRLAGATGVWIQDAQGLRKICAIGIRCSRGITMHGLALNISTDLSFFNLINPCGFTDKTVTSLKNETGFTDMQAIKKGLKALFLEKFK